MSRKPSPPATPAIVSLTPLKNCLLNLPVSLVNVLVSANTPAQNVIVELSFRASVGGGSTATTTKSAYAGWTGMQSKRKPTAGSGRSEEAMVEMDPAFARNVGFSEGSKVSIHLHLDPTPAHTFHIEPLTASDWEIIELHANFLELNLISQIRCVSPAHPISVYLSPTSTASIRVTKVEPESALSSPNGFAKVSPEGEIIVAPKKRQRRQSHGTKSATSTVKTAMKKRSDGGGAGAMFFRGVSLPAERYLPKTDDDEEEEEVMEGDEDREEVTAGGKGFSVYLDPTLLMSSRHLRSVSHVVVSVVRPPAIAPPQDPPQQQQQPEEKDKKDKKDATPEVVPASKIVAVIRPWDSAPDGKHVALSKLLSAALHLRPGQVGDMVRLEPAPQQVPQKLLSKIKVFPFQGTEKQDGLKWGGGTKRLEEMAVARLQEVLGPHRQRNGTKAMIEEDKTLVSPGESVLEGALTDGLVLPAIRDSPIAAGGILKIEVSAGEGGEASQSIKWVLAADKKLSLEIGSLLPKPAPPPAAISETLFVPETESDEPIVGVDDIFSSVTRHLLSSSSVLLSGAHGSGKTSILRLIAKRLSGAPHFHRIIDPGSLSKLSEERVGTVKENATRWFTEATWTAGKTGHSILLLDDLDRLCASESENQDNSRVRQIAEVVVAAVKKHTSPGGAGGRGGVVVLASCQAKESMHNLVVGGHVFRETISLKAMSKEGRRTVLEGVVGATSGVLEKGLELRDIAAKTEGYMPGDLVLLVGRARHEAVVRMVDAGKSKESPTLTLRRIDFDSALRGFVPAGLRGVKLQTSGASWRDIGGLMETRKILLETLEWPTKYAPIFASCPLRLRSGLLLYGYPGCGKTLLASAVAGECGLSFISVKGPEILNKYIGASEKSVRDLFERASGAKPCVLFFDEFDSIAPKRGHDSTGVTDRVVNQMLTQMDGAEGLDGVYVLAATSRPDLIDPALLRPGRLDKSLLCDLPNLEDRLDIFRALVGEGGKLRVGPGVSLEELAARTEGYSGADLQAVLYNAHLEAVQGVISEEMRKREALEEKEGASAADKDAKEELDFLEFVWGDSRKGKAQAAPVLESLKKQSSNNSSSNNNNSNNNPATKTKQDAGTAEVTISWLHVESSLHSTRPSISPEERKRLRGIYTEFIGQRNGEMPNGQGSTEVGGRSSLM
ncbi:AAA-domain-containing protein [Choiromyces venosus 120613-1]|uniref:Peroxisomal ATPase PEX1 n=1 Tax=Choiromyces venosus 120613-1 TaxID=1336337 RepID=A0A3N4JWB3_9PEZI|nr:AAA-domain-containing protein [Choiromyces venosus 120613-1]